MYDYGSVRDRGESFAMKCPLAVYAPYLGARSETFIARHMRDLLPGRTAIIVDDDALSGQAKPAGTGPLLELNRLPIPSSGQRLFNAFQRRLGIVLANRMDAAVRCFLAANGVRVFLGEYLNMSLRFLRLARGMDVRFFAHAHGYDVSRCLKEESWCTQYLQYKDAQGVITMSEVSKKRLVALGLPPERIHVVPYGVDVPLRRIATTGRDQISCVAVGRMVSKKAPILALDAFRRASEVIPGLHLNYVGAGQLLPAAQHYVQALNLSERVTLHGSQPNEVVLRLMQSADLFIQHSMTDPETGDEEGLPVAILEAMAQGLPVVSTRHAGIPEAVTEGLTGYLVEEGDSKGMAERIVTLASDPELRERMGQAGWLRARDRFSWEIERAELLKVMGLHPTAAS